MSSLPDAKPTHFAHTPSQAGSADEIRPPLPDERMASDKSGGSLCVAIAAIALTAAIAGAVILSLYLSRCTPSNRATIEAIDVKALVERIIKVTGHRNLHTETEEGTSCFRIVRVQSSLAGTLQAHQNSPRQANPKKPRAIASLRSHHRKFRTATWRD